MQRDDAPVDAGDGYGHDGQAYSVLAEEGVSDALLAAIELDNCLLRHLGTSQLHNTHTTQYSTAQHSIKAIIFITRQNLCRHLDT
jgi:hypothetical protein